MHSHRRCWNGDIRFTPSLLYSR